MEVDQKVTEVAKKIEKILSLNTQRRTLNFEEWGALRIQTAFRAFLVSTIFPIYKFSFEVLASFLKSSMLVRNCKYIISSTCSRIWRPMNWRTVEAAVRSQLPCQAAAPCHTHGWGLRETTGTRLHTAFTYCASSDATWTICAASIVFIIFFLLSIIFLTHTHICGYPIFYSLYIAEHYWTGSSRIELSSVKEPLSVHWRTMFCWTIWQKIWNPFSQ